MSFDRLAPHYRWMEWVLAGQKLDRCRTAFLDKIPAPKNILLLGEGHGRCLVECRRRFPDAQITCLDASAAMLAQAHIQLEKLHLESPRVKYVQVNVLDWTPTGGPFDLIVTNFFLDCFRPEQLEVLISKLVVVTAAEANWLLADFQVASSGWKLLRSRLILWSMYVFFRVVTRLPANKLTPPDRLLEHFDFQLRARTEFEWGLLHSDWWTKRGAH